MCKLIPVGVRFQLILNPTILWMSICIVSIDRLHAQSVVQDNKPKSSDVESFEHLNLALPTLGGKQFWTDHRWWNGWRVQWNNTTQHWRLLDPTGVRRAWGSRQEVMSQMDRLISDLPSEPTADEYVILAHGLMRTSSSMQPLAEALMVPNSNTESRSKPNINADDISSETRVPILFTYASSRDSIEHHSQALRELIESLPESSRISFVGHSLGNIVFRHAMGVWKSGADPKGVLPRLHRVVMLGPPNQGARLATTLSRLKLFEIVVGRSGKSLGPEWDSFQESLATPPCPFAIFVGDLSEQALQNPLLEGANDGVVTVAEASLAGAAKINAFPVLHTFLMSDPKIIAEIDDFLSRP